MRQFRYCFLFVRSVNWSCAAESIKGGIFIPEIIITVRDKLPTVTGPLKHIVSDNTDYTVRFLFDSEWDGLDQKTVFFADGASGENMPVLMDGSTCAMPLIPDWHTVLIGVQAGELHTTRPAAIPVFSSIARQIGEIVPPEEFDKWTQIMARLLSPVDKTAAMTQPVGRDASGKLWTKPLPEATIDHRDLTNRDAADQHPISAITGLEETLDEKQPFIEDLDTIRAGADAGSTAVQPEDLPDIPQVDATLSQQGQAADAKAAGDALAGAVVRSAQSAKTSAHTEPVGMDASGKLWSIPGSSGSGGTSEPHPYAFDGVNLKEFFGTATALHNALAAGDYSHIHNGDYYPITFQGTYRDYGEWVAPAETKYYSNTACTEEAGAVETDTVVSHVDASPAYYSITIAGTAYYVRMQDCRRWREKTISMNALMEANINPYWRYGDSGPLSGAKPHICWIARDGIGNSFKMRSTNQQWADAVEQFETGDGTTSVYTPDDATLKCVRYVCVNGALETYNTGYTVRGGTVTFKSGHIPANGAAIIISRTTHDNPWCGSAIYQTLNDPDHGLMNLITDTDFASYILGEGGMRYYGETRTVADSLSGTWFSRGKGFLPLEPEVWGESVLSYTGFTFLPQLPVFAGGGRRHIGKGSIYNSGARSPWWLASSDGADAFCGISLQGFPYSTKARQTYALVPGCISI